MNDTQEIDSSIGLKGGKEIRRAGADITNAKGLTPAQIDSLLALGAIDRNK